MSTSRKLHLGWILAIGFLAATTLGVLPAAAFEHLSNMGGNVRVDVTPKTLSPGQPAEFQVWLTTHMGSLSQDLVKISELRDNLGHTYRPAAWDGTPLGGHHRRGILRFGAIDSGATGVTLIIRNLAGIPERAFNWQVSK